MKFIVLVIWCMVMWGIFLYSSSVESKEVNYNVQEGVQAKALYRAEYQTRYCMYQSANTFLMQGMRDEKQLVNSMVSVCSNKFKATVIAYKIPMAEFTNDYLTAMAYDELNFVLSFSTLD